MHAITTAVCGMGLPFKETDGHLAFFKVNVICADLFAVAIILHFYPCISSKLCCHTSIEDAISWFLFTAVIAVSSMLQYTFVAKVVNRLYIQYIKLYPEHFPVVQILFCEYLCIDFLLLESIWKVSRILKSLYWRKCCNLWRRPEYQIL